MAAFPEDRAISGAVSEKSKVEFFAGIDLDALKENPPRDRALIVDDDPAMVNLLKYTLRTAGMDVMGALDGSEALQKCIDLQPDIVLLDLMMPQMDGWETLQKLRQITKVPVLIVSAKDSKEDIVRGLEIGADDYLPKPFNPQELLARIQAVMRRAAVEAPESKKLFAQGDLLIDFEMREVTRSGRLIELSPKEFSVLEVLTKRAPKPVSYEELAESVWGKDQPKIRERIKWVIFRLRQKLEQDPTTPRLILNRAGMGYQLNPEVGPIRRNGAWNAVNNKALA
jgi:DNA-binding response OmpR family regulator